MDMVELPDVIVGTDQTILQAFGGEASFKMNQTADEHTTGLVALSLEDTRLCFMELSRRVIVGAICNAAMALVRLECLGCRIDSCDGSHIAAQHAFCKKTPQELLLKSGYAGFFTGYLFAGGPGGFLLDNQYYAKVAPYVNVNSLVEGKGLASWFPPTTILGVYLRKLEGYTPFFSGVQHTSVKGLYLDDEVDVDAILLFMCDVGCSSPTRSLVVIADADKKLNRGQQLVTVAKAFEGETGDGLVKGQPRVKRQRTTRLDL